MTSSLGFEALIEAIRRLPYGSIFKIEGCSGAGKSTLARELADVTRTGLIHVDDYLQDKKNVDESVPYVDRIDYRKLANSVIAARSNDNGMLIEGICLHVVLHRLQLEYDSAVYVKRVSSAGIWHDGIDIEDFCLGVRRNLKEPELSDMRYHQMHTPHLVIEDSYIRVEP